MELLNSAIDKVSPVIDDVFEDADNDLYRVWKLMNFVPKGNQLFSKVLGFFVPYTGTISPLVEDVDLGYAKVSIEEHRRIRNHLNSIHAIALANLIELTGNLALVSDMPPDARFIVEELNVSYEKKARGTVTAESRTPSITSNEEATYDIEVTVRDEDNDVTTKGNLKTLVGPEK